MSRQTTRALPRCGLNRDDSLERCARSITKMMSAQCSSSGVTRFSASWLSPAEDVSMPGQLANTCSAVGLRNRFWLQMKRTWRAKGSAALSSGSGHGRFCREERLDRLRPSEQVALCVVDLHLLQDAVLRFGLDLFGDGALADHVGDVADRTHDRLRQRRGFEAADEAAVDLDVVDVEIAEVAERTEAGAEVVQREAATEVAHLADEALRALAIADDAGFGDFQAQVLRRETAAA